MQSLHAFKLSLVLTFIFYMPLVGCAANNQDRPKGPPPEAFTACEDKAVGDIVSFKGQRGEALESTCQMKNGKLVAVPDNMPAGGPPK